MTDSAVGSSRSSRPSVGQGGTRPPGRADYQRRLGRRLREIRKQQDLTLQDVDDASDGRWKAVVIGAYERGDRAISAAKLAALASFYGVPVIDLLPEEGDPVPPADLGAGSKIVLDLGALSAADLNPGLRPLSRFATTIQRQRRDYAGQVLSLRRDDVRALAVVFGISVENFVERLEREGVLVGSE